MRFQPACFVPSRGVNGFCLPPRPIGVPMVRCVRFVVNLPERASVYPTRRNGVYPYIAVWNKGNAAAI